MHRTTRLPQTCCPLCDHKLDSATAGPGEPEATPEPGDVTICISCVSLLVFTETLGVRQPTSAELVELMAMPEAVAMIRGLGRAKGLWPSS